MLETESLDYEKVREENIRRNKQFLDEIGLTGTMRAKQEQKPGPGRKIVSDKVSTDIHARRSSRIAALPLPDYKEPVVIAPASRQSERMGANPHKLSLELLKRRRSDHADGLEATPLLDQPVDPKSCRVIRADVEYFRKAGVLGFPMAEFGKRAVMAAANGGREPKFNKYSGVAEWQNALFLWINIDPYGNEYPNEFLDEGRAITWFGGSRMVVNSPVVERLLGSFGSQCRQVTDDDGADTVLLFVRVPNGNYISLGRISCQAADLSSHPIRMTWQLDDYNLLTGSEGLTGNDEHSEASRNFKDIVVAATLEQ